jgi:hypothetical protein
MADVAITSTFVAGTTIASSEVNTNFADIVNYINARNTGSAAWDVLKSAGATTLSSTLAVTGATTLNSTLDMVGIATFTASPVFNSAISITPTTNQVVLGATRTVTLTAPTPASESRVVTFPDLSANYSVVGTAGTQTIAGTKTFSGQLIGKGTVTDSDAAAGYIGEHLSATVLLANAVTLTLNEFKTVASLTLSPGDWDISATAAITSIGASSVQGKAALSVNADNTTTDHVDGRNEMWELQAASGVRYTMTFPQNRLIVDTETTIYLKCYVNSTSGTPKGHGYISARRVR